MPRLKVSSVVRILSLLMLVAAFNVQASYGIRLDPNMRCPAVENQLGQLLYVNVDGFGKEVKPAIHPDYIKLVKLLNIGGVSVQFGKRDARSMYEATAELLAATELPLLIGGEYLAFEQANQRIVAGNKPGKCAGQHDVLDSFLFKTVGLNHKLSATALSSAVNRAVLSAYNNMGVLGTGKLPIDFAGNAALNATPIVMTHHKKIGGSGDVKNIASLSRPFIRKALYNQTLDKPFAGLLMTDRVNKMAKVRSDYAQYSPDWFSRHPNDDPKAVFAARALLAGHHMVYLKGVARDTVKVYQHLAMMACRDDVDGRRLQYAIAKSFHHISEFKRARAGALSYRPRLDEALIDDVLHYKQQLDAKRCPEDSNFEGKRFEDKSFASLRERIMLAR